MRALDLSGQRFTRLLVVAKADPIGGRTAWHCVCDCGAPVTTLTDRLTRGQTKSCGCWSADKARTRCSTLNLRHGMKGTPEYDAWSNMLDRCRRVASAAFWFYGGRGITVCQAWRDSFEAFYDHIGPRPSSKHSLDRIDNDGNYEPGNVRWATMTQQNSNKRYRKRAKNHV